jgi:hypothetical protein
MGDLLSTSSTPQRYEGINLLLADPEKQFPEEFDPERPWKTQRLRGKVSQQGFIRSVERLNGAFVVALDDFVSTQGPLEDIEPLEDVELCNDATYIIVPRDSKSSEKRVSSFVAICSVVDFQIIADLCSKISPLRSFVLIRFCSSKA